MKLSKMVIIKIFFILSVFLFVVSFTLPVLAQSGGIGGSMGNKPPAAPWPPPQTGKPSKLPPIPADDLYKNASTQFQKGEKAEQRAIGHYQTGDKRNACREWFETRRFYVYAEDSLKQAIVNYYGHPQQGHWKQFLEDLRGRMRTIETNIRANKCRQ